MLTKGEWLIYRMHLLQKMLRFLAQLFTYCFHSIVLFFREDFRPPSARFWPEPSACPTILPFLPLFHPSSTQLRQTTMQLPSSTQLHQTTTQLKSCHSSICTPLPTLFHPVSLDDYVVQVMPFFRLHPFSIPLPHSFARQLCSSGPAILLFTPLFHPFFTQLRQTIVQFRSYHSSICTPFPSLFHLASLDDCAVQVLPFFCLHPFSIPLPPSFARRLCSSGPAILLFALFFHPSSTQLRQTTMQFRSCHSSVCTPLPPLFHPTPPNDFATFDGFLLRALHPSLTQQLSMGFSPARLAPLFDPTESQGLM